VTDAEIEELAFDLTCCSCDLYGDKRREAVVKLTAWRDKILHAAAEKIRALDGCDPAGGAAGYDEGMDIAADWIDPIKEKP
jgi:hypothetical protein